MPRIRTPEDLARAVRARRQELGLTQKQLALAAGLGRVSVLRLENEPEKTQLQTALRVADVLKLDLTAGDADERRPAPPKAAPAPGYGALPFEEILGASAASPVRSEVAE